MVTSDEGPALDVYVLHQQTLCRILRQRCLENARSHARCRGILKLSAALHLQTTLKAPCVKTFVIVSACLPACHRFLSERHPRPPNSQQTSCSYKTSLRPSEKAHIFSDFSWGAAAIAERTPPKVSLSARRISGLWHDVKDARRKTPEGLLHVEGTYSLFLPWHSREEANGFPGDGPAFSNGMHRHRSLRRGSYRHTAQSALPTPPRRQRGARFAPRSFVPRQPITRPLSFTAFARTSLSRTRFFRGIRRARPPPSAPCEDGEDVSHLLWTCSLDAVDKYFLQNSVRGFSISLFVPCLAFLLGQNRAFRLDLYLEHGYIFLRGRVRAYACISRVAAASLRSI